MAAVDDIYNQITSNSRKRTGRSFFPAANGSAQGQTIQFSGAGGGGFRALPPDQNPAYQAAIANGRPNRSGYTTITLPSGGTASVPISSAQKYLDLFPARPAIPATTGGAPAVAGQNAASIYDPNRAQDLTHIQNQLQFPQIYNQGYANNYTPTSAPLTPQERVQRGQAGFGQIASVAAHNIFGVPQNQNIFAGLARNWFGGPGGQQAAQYGSNISTGQLPSNPVTTQQPSVQSQNFYAYNPSPVPVRTRYSDPNVPSYFP